MDICITDFQSDDALDFIPALSCLGASQTNVWVRLHDLSSTNHVWVSVRMLVVASMSMNLSCSFEKSCPSNVGISWSMVMVRFDSLWVAHRESMYACMVLCTGSSLDWGAECGWSIMVLYCSFSVS